MEHSFEKSFREYLSSRVQDVKSEHSKRTPTYHRLKERQKNYTEIAEEIIEHLPHNDREIMLEFFDNAYSIQTEEELIIYNRGMRDGISILHYLEAL